MTTDPNMTEPAAAPPAQTSLMTRLGTVPVSDHGIQLSNMDDIFRFAKAVAMSQLCPPGFSETDCFVIIANGLEVGMSPMAALASTYVVNNRATIFGDMPLALVRKSGLLVSYKQAYEGKEYDDDFRCVVTTKRKGEDEPITTSYSVRDAKTAEVWGKTVTKNGKEFKTPWITAPKRMLLFRARGFNLRDNFADVLKGCAIAELNDEENQAGFEHAKAAQGRVVNPSFDGEPKAPRAIEGGPPPAAAPPAEKPISTPPAEKPAAEPPKRGPGRPRKAEPAQNLFGPRAMPSPEEIAKTPPFTAEEIAEAKRTGQITQDFLPAEEKKPELTGPAAEVMRRLEADKLDVAEFIKVMDQNGYLGTGGTTLKEVLDDGLQTALGQWDQVVAHLREIDSEKGPFA